MSLLEEPSPPHFTITSQVTIAKKFFATKLILGFKVYLIHVLQEEYEAKELVGTLQCGHKYHMACIKQWLTMKNMCPICKTSALSANRNGCDCRQ
jgi:hypothetical protein